MEENKNSLFDTIFNTRNLRLLGILLVALVLIIVLANQTANSTLRTDTAEDIPGDVEDIADEVFSALELVEETASGIADNPSDLRTALAETIDEDALPVISQVGLYNPEGTTQAVSLADVTDPDAVSDAPVQENVDVDTATFNEENPWVVLDDVVRYAVPAADDTVLWFDIPRATLDDLLVEGALGEALFSDTEAGYALLVDSEGQVIANFNQDDATTTQIESLLGELDETTFDEDGEYYEISEDPVNEEASFVALLEADVNNWQVIGSFPTGETPTQNIVETSMNLFDATELGNTISLAVEDAVDFLNEDVGWLFRGLRWPIEQAIDLLEGALLAVPWFVVILGTGVVAALTGGRQVAIISTVGMFAIGMLGLWDLTMTTLAMLITSMAFCVIVGIPVGIWAARSDRVNSIVRSVLDAMQTIHPFVYLVPIVVLFGIGKVPGTIATIIFALPPMVRLTNLGIRQVPEDVVEAGKAFGTSDWQLLRDIQIPLALPSIMAGVNQTLMLSLSMVVIVALIAGGGLGQEIFRAIGRADTGRAVVAGVAVLLLAVVVDRISQGQSVGNRQEE